MFFMTMPTLLLLVGIRLPVSGAISFMLIVGFLIWLIDVLSMRLVVAGRWRGLRGYEV